MTALYAAVIGLTVVVVLIAVLVVAMLRSHAEILRRLERLGIRLDDGDARAPISLHQTVDRPHSAIPDISGVDPNGDPVVISPASGTDPILVAFLSTTCSSCTLFWEGLEASHLDVDNVTYRVVAVTLGASEESPTRAASLARGSVDVVMSSQAWEDFNVPGAPYFAVVDPEAGGVIGEGSASTMDALLTFLHDSVGDRRWDRHRGFVDRTGADRERMIDEELRRSGILPDDPSLHPPSSGKEPTDGA